MSYTEADTRAKFIDKKLFEDGWNEENILREYIIQNPNYVILEEEVEKKEDKKILDYLLHKNGLPLAVVEAKKYDEDVQKHTQQLKTYVKMIWCRFGYITNGKIILQYDRLTENIESVNHFLPPEKIFELNYNKKIENLKNSPLLEPFYQLWNKTPRYYQVKAVNKTIEKILEGQKKLLLVLATWTWKTFIASQLVWKLFNIC